MSSRGSAAIVLADLRLFAGLTLDECAEIIVAPPELLRPLWHRTKGELFAVARGDADPPTSLLQAGCLD